MIHAHRPWMSKTLTQPQPKKGLGYGHAREMCIRSAVSIGKLLFVHLRKTVFPESNEHLRRGDHMYGSADPDLRVRDSSTHPVLSGRAVLPRRLLPGTRLLQSILGGREENAGFPSAVPAYVAVFQPREECVQEA